MEADTLIDFITGRPIPNVGAEENRQAVERLLVEVKGFEKEEILVGTPVDITVEGALYRTRIDVLVCLGPERKGVLLVKCAAGSLGSREREAISAARIALPYQVPLAAVSDGRSASVLDTATGRRLGTGLEAIPDRETLCARMADFRFLPYPTERMEREGLIFRSYDTMTVNALR